MFVVFDMDGTLTNVEHRVHFLFRSPKDWDAFYEACDKDTLTPWVLVYESLYDVGHEIEIWTGRREGVRGKTEAWLSKHEIPPPHRLLMRADDDRRHDTEVKAEWIKLRRPDLVFEDRNSMVDLYRSHGIPCAQVAPGDF